jgi:beta-ketoacyl-acyl-carrier-protein synthase II
MGTINPLGHSVEATWDNLVQGISGVGPITLFDTSKLEVKIACEVKDFRPEDYMTAREARRKDRFEQFAIVAASQAIQQAHLGEAGIPPDRIGVIVSSAIGGLNAVQDAVINVRLQGSRKVSPFAIPMIMSNAAAAQISMDYGFRGPSFSVNSACASGADAIGLAWSLVRSGVIDAAITGSADATITDVGIGTFDRIGALSHHNEDYSNTPQPFDLNRDGLVMGEGAALLVVERESIARVRGAHILGELAGYGSSSDAFHITAPSEDGSGGALAIHKAMQSAGISPAQVDYINAHGTGTVLNDLSETKAIKAAMGEYAYNIPVSSTKSMTGHMMGATGALETIICLKAVEQGVIPPTIHYHTPDPQCDLDYVPNQARKKNVHIALTNAFGFGGHNAVLVIRSFRGS